MRACRACQFICKHKMVANKSLQPTTISMATPTIRAFVPSVADTPIKRRDSGKRQSNQKESFLWAQKECILFYPPPYSRREGKFIRDRRRRILTVHLFETTPKDNRFLAHSHVAVNFLLRKNAFSPYVFGRRIVWKLQTLLISFPIPFAPEGFFVFSPQAAVNGLPRNAVFAREVRDALLAFNSGAYFMYLLGV